MACRVDVADNAAVPDGKTLIVITEVATRSEGRRGTAVVMNPLVDPRQI